MIPTPDLIDVLAEGLTPVRRLRGPMTRAAQWLLLVSVLAGVLVVAHGVRPDFWQSGRYALGRGGSVLFDARHGEPAPRNNHPRHAPPFGTFATGVGDADGGLVGLSDHRHCLVADP